MNADERRTSPGRRAEDKKCCTPEQTRAKEIMSIGVALAGVILVVVVGSWWNANERKLQEYAKKVKEVNDRNFRIVQGMPTATVMCDEDGNVVEWNLFAEEMFGWKREEVVGKPVDMMIADSYKAQHSSVFKRAIEKLREVDTNWRIIKTGLSGNALAKDGREFKIRFRTSGINYGGRIEFLAMIHKDDAGQKTDSGPLELPKTLPPDATKKDPKETPK